MIATPVESQVEFESPFLIESPLTPLEPPVLPETTDFFEIIERMEAQEICGSATLMVNGRLVRLYCKRFRVCQGCYERRVAEWGKIVYDMIAQSGRVWRWRTMDDEEAAVYRRGLDSYYSFPTKDGTVIVSPDMEEGEVLRADERLIMGLMRVWVMTPEGKRPSRSHNLVPQEDEERKKQETFLISANMEYIVEMARAMGGDGEAGKDFGIFSGVDNLELVYVLLLAEKRVKRLGNSVIEILGTNDTIFEEWQLKWANGPPKLSGDVPLVR